MHVRLDQGLERELRAHAAAAWPHEACGLLAGLPTGGGWHIRRVAPLQNRSAAPDRFAIDPYDFAHADHDSRARGERVAGVFHSHPGGPARPSRYDLVTAWPEHVQLILGCDSNDCHANDWDHNDWGAHDDRAEDGRHLAAFACVGALWVRVPLIAS